MTMKRVTRTHRKPQFLNKVKRCVRVCVIESNIALIALCGTVLTAVGSYLLCLCYSCLHSPQAGRPGLGFVYIGGN